MSAIPSGLAAYVVRGGRRFFDFKSAQELVHTADRLLGKPCNPFVALSQQEREYIDCLAAIRNMVVHRSNAATISYKRQLKQVYRIVAGPDPDEFLNAIDNRQTSPEKGKSRIYSIAKVIKEAIKNSS